MKAETLRQLAHGGNVQLVSALETLDAYRRLAEKALAKGNFLEARKNYRALSEYAAKIDTRLYHLQLQLAQKEATK